MVRVWDHRIINSYGTSGISGVLEYSIKCSTEYSSIKTSTRTALSVSIKSRNSTFLTRSDNSCVNSDVLIIQPTRVS